MQSEHDLAEPLEVKYISYLRESLLLKVRDDTLSQQVRRTNDIQHLFIVVAQKSELEAILSGIDRDRARTCRTVETVHDFAFDTRQIDRIIESANDAVVARQNISGCCEEVYG